MAKYTITKRPLTPNSLWDDEKGGIFCSFSNGKIETDDDGLAEKLEALGHTVTRNADADEKSNAESSAEGDAYDPIPDDDGLAEKTATKGRRSRK